MIQKSSTKVAVFLFLMLAALGVAAALLERASERPVTYRYFDEALPADPSAIAVIDWLAPDVALDRPFLESERMLVGKRLTEAWAAHGAALETGWIAPLADHFSGPALTRATAATTVKGAHMAVLKQVVRPTFYHSDGSLAAIDSSLLTARFLLDEAGALSGFELAQDQTRSILMNESSGWRVYAHDRQGRALLPRTPARPVGTGPEVSARLAGMNYYPAATPWDRFWPAYDRAIIAADLDRMRDLGANAVRIFLPREDFLNPVTKGDHLARLTDFLYLARERDLWVVPTLFDLRQGYETAFWAYDHGYLEDVLPRLVACRCVAYVDLKNEPDLDYPHYGQGLVQAWLSAMAGATRRLAPDLPLTIGWARAERAADLADIVDVISYHEYADLDGTTERLRQVRSWAGAKPVHVTEIGRSSWSLLLGIPGSPTRQARDLGQRAAALQGADGLMVWTLHDFPDPDPDHSVLGRSPWHRHLQSRFGVIAPDGTEKPAGQTLRAAFDDFLKGQENAY